jgi:hypothetical protein
MPQIFFGAQVGDHPDASLNELLFGNERGPLLSEKRMDLYSWKKPIVGYGSFSRQGVGRILQLLQEIPQERFSADLSNDLRGNLNIFVIDGSLDCEDRVDADSAVKWIRQYPSDVSFGVMQFRSSPALLNCERYGWPMFGSHRCVSPVSFSGQSISGDSARALWKQTVLRHWQLSAHSPSKTSQ